MMISVDSGMAKYDYIPPYRVSKLTDPNILIGYFMVLDYNCNVYYSNGNDDTR